MTTTTKNKAEKIEEEEEELKQLKDQIEERSKESAQYEQEILKLSSSSVMDLLHSNSSLIYFPIFHLACPFLSM